MNAAQRLIACSCLLFFDSAIALAQEANPRTPIAETKARNDASPKTPKADVHAPQGPFLVKLPILSTRIDMYRLVTASIPCKLYAQNVCAWLSRPSEPRPAPRRQGWPSVRRAE